MTAQKHLTTLPLVAATYFMVSGGPYGLEELIAHGGYARALLILAITPLVWSLPTALMVGELSAALPEEGGYYAWVRRALGPFWGFVEAWMSLLASIFDMAIYPTLFTLYLGKLWPWINVGEHAMWAGAAMIVTCALWNMRGARAVGGASLVMTIALLAPFFALAGYALLRPTHAPAPATLPHGGLMGGMLIAMWNYMGWDNSSTISGEVENPQRTYPLAMLTAVFLVAITYLIPVAAVAFSGLDCTQWTTGSFVDAGRALGGNWLATGIVFGGVLCGVGMFNALVMSYSRIPVVLARDGFLPKIFGRVSQTGAPIFAIALCCVAYTAALRLGFDRLIELDVLIYGSSLALEFVALVALRIREPKLPRPFVVPGGLPGAIVVGFGPLGLLAIALYQGRGEKAGPLPALGFAALCIAVGPVVYAIQRVVKRQLHL